MPPHLHRLLHGVPGGAGNVGDDHPVKARQGVEEAGLSSVGLSENHRPDAPAQDLSPAVGGENFPELSRTVRHGGLHLREYQRINVLVGVVELGVKVRQNIGEPVVDRRNFFPHGAAQLAGGVGGGLGALGLDEVDDGLGLGKIHPAIQKSALGELPGACLPGALGKERLQGGREHRRRAVTVKLRRILAGIGVGCPGHGEHGLVDDAPLAVVEGAQDQLAILHGLCGGLPPGRKHGKSQRDAALSREAHDSDGADHAPGGHGGNDI